MSRQAITFGVAPTKTFLKLHVSLVGVQSYSYIAHELFFTDLPALSAQFALRRQDTYISA